MIHFSTVVNIVQNCKYLPMSYQCLTNVLPMSYQCLTNVLQCLANVLQMSYKCLTNVLQMSYKCLTNVQQMSYQCLTIVLHVWTLIKTLKPNLSKTLSNLEWLLQTPLFIFIAVTKDSSVINLVHSEQKVFFYKWNNAPLCNTKLNL